MIAALDTAAGDTFLATRPQHLAFCEAADAAGLGLYGALPSCSSLRRLGRKLYERKKRRRNVLPHDGAAVVTRAATSRVAR